jgi:nitronate monooxygenase
VPIHTALTRRFALQHPIVLAPMGGVSGGRLAATVSNAGALGFVGGGYGDLAWVERELELVAHGTTRPWGVGFITWSLTPQVLDLALRFKPCAVMLSFGDPVPWTTTIKASGCALFCQVQDRAGAAAAVTAGADFVVAQGTEAGGHGGRRSTFPLVPAVADMVAPTPVLAAGGVADGRGLAASIMLGAHGAVIGTRFYASVEALGHEKLKQEIAARGGDDTVRTRLFDLIRGHSWPARHDGRAVSNSFIAQWQDRQPEATRHTAELNDDFRQSQASGDVDGAMIWAGECMDLIRDVRPAAALVHEIGVAAEMAIRRAQALSA